MKPQSSDEFVGQVAQILRRYAEQNRFAVPTDDVARGIGERLVSVIAEHGLPAPLGPEDMGEPGELSADEIEPRVNKVIGGVAVGPLENAIRQLVKACFYPEFKKCRESYHEIDASGTCRRQMLERVRQRVSGAHCVDCPYWLSLNSEQHAALLESAWVGDHEEFRRCREIFLPDDFRMFRRMARGMAGSTGRRTSL
jgi:hypothetical protein